MPKLIKLNTNGTKEEYSGSISSNGVSSSGEFPILGSDGKLDVTFLPSGVGVDAVTATAGESLVAGNFVYFNGSGNVLKADATTIGKQARGYVLSSVSNGNSATVYFDDSNSSLSGLTVGSTYYLSTTSGLVTTTSPTGSGYISQEIGFATSTTNLRVNIKQPIIRA